jgi:hypothetical protein
VAKSKHSVAKSRKAWLQALEEMRAALTANPLVADPFIASAQVFDDIGEVIFSEFAARKKRAKPKRASAKKKPAGRARKR